MSDAFAELLAQVAEEFGVTPEEVYRDIEEAIAAAMAEAAADPDPTAREIWARMPRAGARPTPEEMIAFLSGMMLLAQARQDDAAPPLPLH